MKIIKNLKELRSDRADKADGLLYSRLKFMLQNGQLKSWDEVAHWLVSENNYDYCITLGCIDKIRNWKKKQIGGANKPLPNIKGEQLKMTNKAYNLIVMVLKYGQINFWGGNDTLDFDDYRKLDKELYYRICDAIEELDKGEQK